MKSDKEGTALYIFTDFILFIRSIEGQEGKAFGASTGSGGDPALDKRLKKTGIVKGGLPPESRSRYDRSYNV